MGTGPARSRCLARALRVCVHALEHVSYVCTDGLVFWLPCQLVQMCSFHDGRRRCPGAGTDPASLLAVPKCWLARAAMAPYSDAARGLPMGGGRPAGKVAAALLRDGAARLPRPLGVRCGVLVRGGCSEAGP